MKKFKKIPKFKNEDEERDFWAKADTSQYFDWNNAVKMDFSKLQPSVKSISLRLPEWLYEDLKILAHKRDVAYQALMKVFLADRVRQELQVG